MGTRALPAMRVLLLALAIVASLSPAESAMTTANPIRKVVKMLQAMQKKVQEEGDKADKLHDQFMCYCKNGGADLEKSISASKLRVKELPPSIESDTSQKTQVEESLKSRKDSRSAAVKAIQDATKIREKERALFEKDMTEQNITIKAVDDAVAMLKKGGSSSSFVQTQSRAVLSAYLEKNRFSLEQDRQDALAFICGTQGEETVELGSGEVIGILITMRDTMVAERKNLVREEESAIESFEKMKVTKGDEQNALTKSMEKGLEKEGELGIDIATMQHDLDDSTKSLEEDTAFVANLERNCATAQGNHDKEQQMRAQELVALSETIKMLNDDDALDLFKKTLPSASSSFLQLQTTTRSVRAEAQAIVAQARSKLSAGQSAVHLDFISLALHGKKYGLSDVLKMIDELMVTLKSEQAVDDEKKGFCTKELDTTEDKQKALKFHESDLEAIKEDALESKATLKKEIEALKQGIIDLDKSVADATVQRKEENAEFKENRAMGNAAKELIRKARDRMKQFYTKQALVQTSDGLPPPPPEAANAYRKKDSAGGVMAMMQGLINDLDNENTAATAEEKFAQQDYEKTMSDSAEKRALDGKSITDKEASRVSLDGELETNHADIKALGKELGAVEKYLMEVHADCDWMMQNFAAREAARKEEIDSMIAAREAISGINRGVSLVQVTSSRARARKFLLRGSAV